MECYHHLQDFIVINSPMVKFSSKFSNPAVFGEIQGAELKRQLDLSGVQLVQLALLWEYT